MERVIAAVEPTDEQRQQLRAIAADHIRAMKAAEADRTIALQSHREQIEALRRQLREAHKEGNTEQAKTLRTQLDDLTGTPTTDVLKATHEKIAGILTAEQKVKFDALVEEMRTDLGRRGAGDRPGFRAGKAGKAGKQSGDRGPEGGKRGRHGAPPPPAAESEGT
jgi:Spy/CpxP family protein refolding chaperone